MFSGINISSFFVQFHLIDPVYQLSVKLVQIPPMGRGNFWRGKGVPL